MTVEDELRAMLDLLHERGWTQGELMDSDGRVCLVGARDLLGLHEHVHSSSAVALSVAAARLFPDRGQCVADRCMGCFNDHEDTTYEDVVLAIKHAINDLELGEV